LLGRKKYVFLPPRFDVRKKRGIEKIAEGLSLEGKAKDLRNEFASNFEG